MYRRSLEKKLTEALQYYDIVYVGGPRQSGKTTLARHLFPKLPYVNIEHPNEKARVENDPEYFLSQHTAGLIIDEVQNIPELFSHLQVKVDDPDNEAKFILTGSQNFLLMAQITQSLAGRVAIFNLLPLDHEELILADIGSESLDDFAFRGGYPALFERKTPRSMFFPSYIQSYLERDVRQLKNIGDLGLFNRFLELIAGRAAQLLNYSSLSNDLGVAVNTVKSWITVLEASWIIFRLPPFHKNYRKRIVKSTKLYFYDTGLLCYLLQIHSSDQLRQHFAYGSIIENSLIADLRKYRLHKGIFRGMYFYRDSNGREIDLLIDQGVKILAIEIKASHSYGIHQMKNLHYWQDLTNSDSADSYLLYAGSSEYRSRSGLFAPWQQGLEILRSRM